jgi:hypothetical protein
MTASSTSTPVLPAGVATGWYTPDDCRIADFWAVVEETTDPEDYPSRPCKTRSTVARLSPDCAAMSATRWRPLDGSLGPW